MLERTFGGDRMSAIPNEQILEFDVHFERFCAAYPKRYGNVNRTVARAKFESVIRAGADPEEIIAGAVLYRKLCDIQGTTGTEYVLMMSTWLNREHWKADLIAEIVRAQATRLESGAIVFTPSSEGAWDKPKWTSGCASLIGLAMLLFISGLLAYGVFHIIVWAISQGGGR
jgi:hypothetical protein